MDILTNHQKTKYNKQIYQIFIKDYIKGKKFTNFKLFSLNLFEVYFSEVKLKKCLVDEFDSKMPEIQNNFKI